MNPNNTDPYSPLNEQSLVPSPQITFDPQNYKEEITPYPEDPFNQNVSINTTDSIPEIFNSTNMPSSPSEYYPTSPEAYSPEYAQTIPQAENIASSELPLAVNPIQNRYSENTLPGRDYSNILGNDQHVSKPMTNRSSVNKIRKVITGLAITLLFGFFLLLAWNLFSKLQESNKKVNSPATLGISVIAEKYIDLSKACSNKSPITNTNDLSSGSPYKLAIFNQDIKELNKYQDASNLISNQDLVTTENNYLQTQLILCISRESLKGTGIKCQLEDKTNNKYNVEIYDVTYKISVYEAKNNKLVEDRIVNSEKISCPFDTVLDTTNPKIYSPINKTVLNDLVKKVSL